MEQDDYDYEQYSQEGYSNQQYEYEDYSGGGSYDQHSYHHAQMDEEKPFEILPLAKLFLELNQILEEIQGLMYLPKGWCLILLKDFEWDKDNLREKFYDKNQEYMKRAGFELGLDSPDNFDREVEGTCDVCYLQKMQLYQNICGHRYCLDCWMSHLKSFILSSAFPKCMDSQCGRPVLLETVTRLLEKYGAEGAIWLKKYEKKLCEHFITTNRSYQFCTGVDCGNCIKVNTTLETVTCNCGKVFCFACQSDDHYPCKCEEKSKWVDQVVKEEADAKWISQNAKICPSCKKAVQRSMGCNFMACKCGKNFCYMCSQPWQPDHKDHFKCHIFRKKPDDVINRQKEIMERMNHCTQRYIYCQAAANKYKDTDVFAMRKYLFKTLHIDLTESQYMENAFKFAVECCEKLKWIYAFTYFHELKEGKDAFDFTLGEYERFKENLFKMLAVDFNNFMKTVQEWDNAGCLTQDAIEQLNNQFRNLKKQIVNYYTCTKNFKEKFVEELRQITQRMDEQKERKEMQADIGQPLKSGKSGDKQKVKEGKGIKRKRSKKNLIEI